MSEDKELDELKKNLEKVRLEKELIKEKQELDELKRKVDLEKELIKEKHEVRVSFDSQPQPECVISGRVNFSDGKIASWYFDKTGQLSLNPDEESYSPSEEGER